MKKFTNIVRNSKIQDWSHGLQWDKDFSLNINQNHIEDGLWDKAGIFMHSMPFQNVKALLIGFSESDLYMVRTHLKNIGVKLIAFMPTLRHIEHIPPIKDIFTHVFINFDAFEDVETGVDALLNARGRGAHVVIILCSKEVSGDDLDINRILICDATLRLPLTDQRLRQGLVSANANNQGFHTALNEDMSATQ